MAETLTTHALTEAVQTAAALRCRRRLQPAGGPGDKVFPPTYEGGKYALEERIIEGQRRPCVLLDSVQSQANRMELALLEAARRETDPIPLPIIEVDFSRANPPLPEVGVITSLQAPHRIADAILRDSMLGDRKFRDTDEGRAFTDASAQCATELFRLCPTALVFGLWDSTGPKGGLGVKFERALVSEIVGVDAVPGVKTSSRIDPLQIELGAGPLYHAADGGWTLDEQQAIKDKGKPARLGKDGKPSEANHGNVTPAIEADHGGVTMAYAMQTAVLSLPALRRLHFPAPQARPDIGRDRAAWTALAALALCGAVLSIEQGCDLRSRCLLVPESAAAGGWEIIDAAGHVTPFALDGAAACSLLKGAVDAARAAGLSWLERPLTLVPSTGLAELVRRSRELAMQATAEGD